jgi:hypothetical protein
MEQSFVWKVFEAPFGIFLLVLINEKLSFSGRILTSNNGTFSSVARWDF